MAIKTYKPTTPARRGMTTRDNSEVTSRRPGAKSLLTIKKAQSGRNNQGRITVRHRGGGQKRYLRKVSYKLPDGIELTVDQIDYDPNRSAHLALVRESDGTPHYVIASKGLKLGDKISSGENVPIEVGNRLPIKYIPVGTNIHAVELHAGKGAQIARSAGSSVQLAAKEGNWAQIKMPSGEVRKIHISCTAAIGVVGNEQHQNVKIGSAGRNRRLGKRPSVRGKAMNPVDHPMGGGEGQTGPGRLPKTPWGVIAIGKKTRRRKATSKYIVKTRHQAKRRK